MESAELIFSYFPDLTDVQRDKFSCLEGLYREWNAKINVISRKDMDAFWVHHVLHSLAIAKVLQFRAGTKVMDVGTGGGFPGIPLKIAFPHLKVTLMDSLNKRVDFLKEVIEELDLSDINVIHGRAEDFAKPGQLREQYDLCVSRAVANLSVLSEYCLPYVKVGGKFISYKSEKIVEEMKDAEYAIQLLGGRIGEQVSFTLPDSDLFRNLFVVEKCDLTPAKYPRKAGMASKKPLKRG